MTYIRNAEVTIEQVQRLARKCGYQDITSTVCGYAFVIRTPAEEIIGFPSVVAARRLLARDWKRVRAQVLLRQRKG